MGYSATWKILEEIITEFRKEDLPVPEPIMSDLKSAKTLIKLLESGDGQGEISPKVEQYLASVEAHLVTEAQKSFKPERIDEWLRRLGASPCEVGVDQTSKPEKQELRFVAGMPRDQKWVRVKPISSLPLEKLKQLATESALSVRLEEDGHLIVYGKAEDIKEFVRKMTEQAARELPQ